MAQQSPGRWPRPRPVAAEWILRAARAAIGVHSARPNCADEGGARQSELAEPEPFEPETFEPETFEPESFEPETFEPETFEPETLAVWFVEPESFEPESLEPESLDV